jgi:hypothetical protein
VRISICKSFNILSFKHYRVILSTIRYLAACPSPRTLIQKKYIPALGTTADEQRRQHLRIDDDHRREKVETARKFIFEKGLGVKSKNIESRLKEESYTPTRVRLIPFEFLGLLAKTYAFNLLERLLYLPLHIWHQLFFAFRSRPLTRV